MKLTDEQVKRATLMKVCFDQESNERFVAQCLLRLNTPEQPSLLQADPDALLGQRERPAQISEAGNWRERALAAERELRELKKVAKEAVEDLTLDSLEALRALISQKDGV